MEMSEFVYATIIDEMSSFQCKMLEKLPRYVSSDIIRQKQQVLYSVFKFVVVVLDTIKLFGQIFTLRD